MQTLDCPECGEKIRFQWQSEEFDCGVKFDIWKHDIKRMESPDNYVVVCLQDVKGPDPCTLRCENVELRGVPQGVHGQVPGDF